MSTFESEAKSGFKNQRVSLMKFLSMEYTQQKVKQKSEKDKPPKMAKKSEKK
jgi:hypothetical protein